MQVTSFLLEVDVSLITDDNLMTSVARIDGLGVIFVAIAHIDAVKATSDKGSNRIGGAVGHAGIHHLLVVGIYQPGRYISAIGMAVIACQHRSGHFKKRIS